MCQESETLPVGTYARRVSCEPFGTVHIWVHAYYLSISPSVPCSMFCLCIKGRGFCLFFFNIFPDYPCNDTNLQ